MLLPQRRPSEDHGRPPGGGGKKLQEPHGAGRATDVGLEQALAPHHRQQQIRVEAGPLRRASHLVGKGRGIRALEHGRRCARTAIAEKGDGEKHRAVGPANTFIDG